VTDVVMTGSIEMERMWQERADYGHFFYRIPNGESAADAYDRISGFNESLWRQFGDADFPSVCVLVTHGLMTRVFLMKWYHWSVEYFEDLRNINHCEFVVMEQEDNGKYALKTELRTWTEFQARAAVSNPAKVEASPSLTARRWGGCAMGCNHQHMSFPRRTKRQNTMDIVPQLPKPAMEEDEKDDHPIASQEADHANGSHTSAKKSSRKIGTNGAPRRPDPTQSDGDDDEDDDEYDGAVSPTDGHGIHGGSSADDEGVNESFAHASNHGSSTRVSTLPYRGPRSGSPGDISDESDFFDTNVHQLESRMTFRSDASRAALAQIDEGDERGSHRRRSSPASPRRQGGDSRYRKASIKGWAKESGMTGDKKANALGDVTDDDKRVDGDEEGEPKEGTAAADIY
jgi:hypothetical protein